MHPKTPLFFGLVTAVFLSANQAGLCATTIDAANQFAWGPNIGWIGCRGDATNGAVIGEYVCSGYLYAANAGWINLGSGSPTNGIYYQNTAATDFGVNQDGLGNLRGYAWGANIGWLSFEAFGAPKVDLRTGRLSGLAWSANCGWISLSNAVAYVQTDSIQPAPLAPNGLPIAWLLANFGTTNVSASADQDHDGLSNLQEYLDGTDPNNAASLLRINSESFTPGGTSASLTWSSVPTRLYYLEKSLSLSSASWVDSGLGLISPLAGSFTGAAFSDTNAPARFYRVRAVQPLHP